MKKSAAALALLLFPGIGVAQDAPPLMSAPWAKLACETWNADPVLTGELAESGWVKNDAKRGFKVLQIFRTDCAGSPRVELRIAEQQSKARCVYGGEAQTAKLEFGADYVMHAETARWLEMGRGDYGPMGAMMFGRLRFDGPMLEAMGNMGPFESFLRLVGKVPGRAEACPSEAAPLKQ